MARKRRVTHRTDANGGLKEVYRSSWCLGYLERAKTAGVPVDWLAYQGSVSLVGSDEWVEDNDLTGVWADLIYSLNDYMRGEDSTGAPYRKNLSRVLKCFELLGRLCDRAGIDPETEGLIPWDVYDFRMLQYAVNKWPAPKEHVDAYRAAEAEARESFAPEYETVMDGWGFPSGPGHDSHGHGKSPHGWVCLKEGHRDV